MKSAQPFVPKTLIVDLSNFYGGTTSRVLSLLEHMPKGKVLLASLESSAITERAEQLGFPVTVIGKNKVDPRIIHTLPRIIFDKKIQVLDSQNIQSKFWASLVVKQTRTALVSTIHSWYANSEQGKNPIKGKIYTALELATNKYLQHYITVSQNDYRSLRKAGILDENISLIYNAVKIQPESVSGDKDWLCKNFELPSNTNICVAVGRLVSVKGFDILIRAIEQIKRQLPQLVCLIVGDGPLKKTLADQIQQAGLERQVYLLGHYPRETVLKILKASDIFVMPSLYEGTPISLLEAAALGKPIIASDTGGIPELVQHEKQALLVAPGNSESLAKCLIRICREEDLPQQISHSAQKHIRKHFSLDTQIQSTIDAYRKAWNKLQINL